MFKVSQNILDEPRFLEFCNSGKYLYDTPAWQSVIRKTFSKKIETIYQPDGGLYSNGLFLTYFTSRLFGKFAVSNPFVNYGGPVKNNRSDWPELIRLLRSRLNEKNLDFIELRLDEKIDEDLPLKEHKVTFMLDLEKNEEDQLASFKAKVRSQVKRPMKDGFTSISGGLDKLDDFYAIFTRNMRDLGTPVLPKKFFENILTEIPDSAFIAVVNSPEGKAVAASFLIRHHEVMEIPWASSLREYNRFSPNMLLYWESLKLSIEKGCKVFDFGRCTPGSGTYKFKKQWGAEEKPLYWYYILPQGEDLPEINPDNPKYKLMISVWQKLPLFIVNRLGPLLIKNIP